MERERTTSRRALLATVGAGTVALAGCSALGSSPLSSDGDGNESDGGTPSETGTPTPEPGQAAIPTYPYRETGVDPLAAEPDPAADNPTFTYADLPESKAQFAADPFMFVTEDDEWHMFFELMLEKGVIAHATSPDRGATWEYDDIVLDRQWHLSFPYVFKWDGEIYMTTEEGHADAKARLYRAESFPTEWTEETVLFDPQEHGHGMTDNVLFRWNDRWWSVAGAPGNEDTYVYHSDSLLGEWTPHENNPVVTGRKTAARPGGRPIVRDDHVLLFFQDCEAFYGEKVRAYRLTDLSTSTYQDTEVEASPVVDGTAPTPEEASRSWNSVRMHQFDAWYLGEGKGGRVAVDGDGTGPATWSIGIYHVPEGELTTTTGTATGDAPSNTTTTSE